MLHHSVPFHMEGFPFAGSVPFILLGISGNSTRELSLDKRDMVSRTRADYRREFLRADSPTLLGPGTTSRAQFLGYPEEPQQELRLSVQNELWALPFTGCVTLGKQLKSLSL